MARANRAKLTTPSRPSRRIISALRLNRSTIVPEIRLITAMLNVHTPPSEPTEMADPVMDNAVQNTATWENVPPTSTNDRPVKNAIIRRFTSSTFFFRNYENTVHM